MTTYIASTTSYDALGSRIAEVLIAAANLATTHPDQLIDAIRGLDQLVFQLHGAAADHIADASDPEQLTNRTVAALQPYLPVLQGQLHALGAQR